MNTLEMMSGLSINKILYQQHIMWYESKMLNETLDSLQNALQYSTIPVHLKFCLNSQTYLEKPIEGNSEDMFKEFINHPILKNAEITYKTDNESFYNIGDWRREIYSNDYKYTVWGESDCLIPEDYFYILSNLDIEEPHVLSLASRKCWDNTWKIVEHDDFKSWSVVNLNQPELGNDYYPFRYFDRINQQQLNNFNNKNNINIQKLPILKIDGSLLTLSKNLPTPFISPEMNFVREDYCAQQFFQRKNIPQYLISNRIKGHNYFHPLKRTNTSATRDDYEWKIIEQKNIEAMNVFLNNI
jgi:hypothetical protein